MSSSVKGSHRPSALRECVCAPELLWNIKSVEQELGSGPRVTVDSKSSSLCVAATLKKSLIKIATLWKARENRVENFLCTVQSQGTKFFKMVKICFLGLPISSFLSLL